MLVLAAGLAVLIRFAWNRNLAVVARRLAAFPSTPGVTMRVEDAGLSVGGERFAWNAVTVDEVGVLRISSEDSTTELVERLTLSSRGRVVVLDALTISNGAVVVGQAWRHLCAHRVP